MTGAGAPGRERVVLVGAAGFGACWTLGLRRHRDRLDVVAVVDPDVSAREQAATEWGLDRATVSDHLSPEDVARAGATVVIDSSPFVHRQASAEAAFHGGADLIAAKPLGADLQAATTIVDAADHAGRSVAVAQQMRFFPCFLALRDLVRDGACGKVRSAQVVMALDGRGWEPGTAWRLALPQPLLQEASIHHFDLLRWCLDDELTIAALAAWSPPWSPFAGPATATALLWTGQGVPVRYDATFAPGPDEQPVRFDSGWRLVFDDAVVTVHDGGLFVDGEPMDAAPSTDEPVSLDELNAVVLSEWLRHRDLGTPPSFSGHDNLASMRLLDDALDRAA